ncbi:hypothetical protein ACCF70_001051 [Vibrio parahaemolyticus]|uniref:hypothetical protein n=1 Tax=Vibrio parahaemolyticus TaxID=670 RepID=UPI0015E01A18|nr:hypothetical protein [Vibrio parahaemolyticus]EJY0895090.1 hypothetical protein [Vibrio parahaemolyticus]EKO5229643.1 hypothetical protein [Vibrio parahaemolyticus]ELA7343673.1 hypothetical protein [Vibrio parahaemolyticus]ELB2149056.1 hypothetical protein [Vibrio parahaemolyticus]MBE4368637.1 hypothetical protein [Vibrio parahaemolyticus]
MDKYQAAYAKRLSKLKSDNSSPKAIARLCAWDSFFNQEFELQDLEYQMADAARQRYEQSNVKNDISFKAFKRAFYNESIEIYNLTDGAAIQKVFTPLIMLATAWIMFVCSVSN